MLALDVDESPNPSPGQPIATYGTQVGAEATAPLTNPLAFHVTDWVQGPGGVPCKDIKSGKLPKKIVADCKISFHGHLIQLVL